MKPVALGLAVVGGVVVITSVFMGVPKWLLAVALLGWMTSVVIVAVMAGLEARRQGRPPWSVLLTGARAALSWLWHLLP